MTDLNSPAVRPFSCGSQYGDWRDRNCFRCVKSYEHMEPKPKDGKGPCEIDNAVGLAYIGSGAVTPDIARRMGYANVGVYGWDCPERELAPVKPTARRAELGLPDAPPVPCGHAVPAFGCASCITTGRQGFAREAYLLWKQTYVLPPCPSCRREMSHDGFTFNSTEIRAAVICLRDECFDDAEGLEVVI